MAHADGFIARVDFAYPCRRVAVELDGRRYHLHAAAFQADRTKRNRRTPPDPFRTHRTPRPGHHPLATQK